MLKKSAGLIKVIKDKRALYRIINRLFQRSGGVGRNGFRKLVLGRILARELYMTFGRIFFILEGIEQMEVEVQSLQMSVLSKM